MSQTLGHLVAPWVKESALPPDLADRTVCGLSLDSRNIRPGEAFVALQGATAHGATFADQALSRGAVAVIHDPEDGISPTGDDTRRIGLPGLADELPGLADRMWDSPAARLRLHGITGTNGKSSCAWLLAQATRGAMVGTLGTGAPGALQDNPYTTPDILSLYRTLADLGARGFTDVALEVSSHALAQGRIRGLAFETLVFTNLGEDHRDYHTGKDAYRNAKARLFSDYPGRRILINLDDHFGRELVQRYSGDERLWCYSSRLEAEADLRVHIRASSADGQTLELHLPVGPITLQTPLLGGFNAANLLVVAGVLASQGLPVDAIRERLAGLEPVPGRMNRLAGGGTQADVIIDYAHSPDALEQVLAALAPVCQGQLWCVFGCGGERDRPKRPRMGAVAESIADRVILTDDNPRGEDGLSIIREIQSGMARPDRVRVIRDRERAIEAAIREADRADLILIAGKGHERYQEAGGERLPFSDFDAVARLRGEAA